MLEIGKLFDLQREAFSQAREILDLERYLPVMSPEELREFETAVVEARKPVYDPATLVSLSERLSARQNEIEARFASANAKSRELCKPRTVRK